MTINSEELNKIDKDLEKYPNSNLLVVTKNQSLDTVKKLIKMGYCSFGENKVQEAKDKFSSLKKHQYKLHLIGPLQTNKVKLALELFDTFQTLDREKLVIEIVNQIKKKHRQVYYKKFFHSD